MYAIWQPCRQDGGLNPPSEQTYFLQPKVENSKVFFVQEKSRLTCKNHLGISIPPKTAEGLPDGIFSKKSQFGRILAGLPTADADMFSGHLGQLMVIWYIFSRFGKVFQEKSGNPELQPQNYFQKEQLFGSTFYSIPGMDVSTLVARTF
jgi:hypothetical protein